MHPFCSKTAGRSLAWKTLRWSSTSFQTHTVLDTSRAARHEEVAITFVGTVTDLCSHDARGPTHRIAQGKAHTLQKQEAVCRGQFSYFKPHMARWHMEARSTAKQVQPLRSKTELGSNRCIPNTRSSLDTRARTESPSGDDGKEEDCRGEEPGCLSLWSLVEKIDTEGIFDSHVKKKKTMVTNATELPLTHFMQKRVIHVLWRGQCWQYADAFALPTIVYPETPSLRDQWLGLRALMASESE